MGPRPASRTRDHLGTTMPQIMRTIDEIMAAAQRDMLFVDFKDALNARRSRWRKRHFDWFAANNLRSKPAAPNGWLSGDPGIYVVFFDSVHDARVGAYAAAFEDANGKSLHPGGYQKVIVQYRDWL